MQQFLNYSSALKTLLSTATFRQSTITFLGTAISGLLGAGFYILAARVLGPADFGLLAVAIAALTLVADIGDLGTDTGLVRFVGKYLKGKSASRRRKAYRFLKLALEVKLVLGLLIAILGWFLAPFVAELIFEKPRLAFPLKLAFVGSLTFLLFSFSTSAFQALQKFVLWSGIQVGTNTVRLFVVAALWFLGNLNLETALSTYVILPLLGFVASLLFIPRDFLRVSKSFRVAPEFFHYNKWVALFTLLAAVSARLDTFITARLLPATQVGFYAAATQLVVIVPQIVVALGTVIAPKMAGMSAKKIVGYLKKTQVLVLALAALGVIAIPAVIFLIPLLYGSAYASSVPSLFVVLLLGMLVFLISVPVHNAVFYYFGYPRLFVFIALGHLAIIAILGWYMISNFGAMGAAITVLVGHIFNFVIPAVWVLRKVRESA